MVDIICILRRYKDKVLTDKVINEISKEVIQNNQCKLCGGFIYTPQDYEDAEKEYKEGKRYNRYPWAD